MDMGEQPKHRCYAEIAVDWSFTGAAPSAPATQNRSKALEQNVTEHSWVMLGLKIGIKLPWDDHINTSNVATCAVALARCGEDPQLSIPNISILNLL